MYVYRTNSLQRSKCIEDKAFTLVAWPHMPHSRCTASFTKPGGFHSGGTWGSTVKLESTTSPIYVGKIPNHSSPTDIHGTNGMHRMPAL